MSRQVCIRKVSRQVCIEMLWRCQADIKLRCGAQLSIMISCKLCIQYHLKVCIIFLLTTITNIIYAHACLCVAFYMHALFMLAACVEHNANGSFDCCNSCHTIPATVPPMYMSLPITAGAWNLSKWQNPHCTFTKHSLPAVTLTHSAIGRISKVSCTRLSTAVLCLITLFCPSQD